MADRVREAALQVDTAARAAANVLTLGGADHFAAGMDALFEPGGLSGFDERYRANLAEQRARNLYDQKHRANAQTAGSIAGTLLGVRALGPGTAPAFVPRLAGAAPVTAREAATVVGLGGGAGLAAQGASDIANGGRRSTWGDKAGAIAGGMAGAAALPLGPGRAAAVGAWVTSASQDALNSRPVSFNQAGQSALAGRLLGDLGGKLATRWADDLSSAGKGRLGEALGNMRSTVNGKRRELAPKSRDKLPSGRHWYSDGRSGSTRFEDKFGYHASLSANQKLARAQLGEDFVLYHFVPDDLGHVGRMLASIWAPHVTRNQPWGEDVQLWERTSRSPTREVQARERPALR